MAFDLQPHVHAVAIEDDLVLLDVLGDAYHCLPQAGPAWRSATAGRCDSAAPALAAVLTEHGFIDGRGSSRPRSAPPPLPLRGLDEDPSVPIGWRDVVGLAGALADLLAHYRGRPLRHILHYVRRDGPAPAEASPDDPELRRLCAVFERAIPWAPVPGKCLVRSFLLLRFLQRAGFDATWAFGVRTWPFAAHCWLQAGDIVLDDHPERLAPYIPILGA